MSDSRRRQLTQLIAEAQALVSASSDRHVIEDAQERIEGYEEELTELGPAEADEQIFTLTSANFSQAVLQSELPVLVDFWAEWCGPCRQITPLLAQLIPQFGERVRFGKLSVDEAPSVASQLDVQTLPTLIIFQKGRVVEVIRGVPGLEDLRTRLARIVG